MKKFTMILMILALMTLTSAVAFADDEDDALMQGDRVALSDFRGTSPSSSGVVLRGPRTSANAGVANTGALFTGSKITKTEITTTIAPTPVTNLSPDLQKLKTFISKYQKNPYDVDGSGLVLVHDVMAIGSNITLAIKLNDAGMLPKDMAKALDLNGDGKLDANDIAFGRAKVIKALTDSAAANNFAKDMQKDPYDLNHDGAIDDKDVQLSDEKFAMAIYMEQYAPHNMGTALKLLDLNGDGVVDKKDMEISGARIISKMDKDQGTEELLQRQTITGQVETNAQNKQVSGEMAGPAPATVGLQQK